MVIFLSTLTVIALAVATAAVSMALLKPFPVEWLYYHYFIRKPVVWSIFAGTGAWIAWETWRTGSVPLWSLLPLFLMGLAVALAYRLHQEAAFQAVDFPKLADDPSRLPLTDAMQLAVIEHDGVTKAYPLDYVIHHHIINDRFGDATVALTYCAMCRTVIAFDVSDIGPLFVASFKHANMIVADRRTRTFFQQATFESIIGPLHPRTLSMLYSQILSWREVRQLQPMPCVVEVTEHDLRAFELPIPGIWKRIVASEATPGLTARERDATFPARTRVIGVIDPIATPQIVYLKDELLGRGVVRNEQLGIVLVAGENAVNGFQSTLDGAPLQLDRTGDGALIDAASGTSWDRRGKYLGGPLQTNLTPVALSDEYWFSWRRFHPSSRLIRV